MKVLKFGGASVKDATGVRNLLEILKTTKNDKEVLIVVSAMGKTTRKLRQVADNYLNWEEEDYDAPYDPDADDEFDDWDDEISWNSRKLIEQYHHQIMSELFDENHIVFKEVGNYFEEIKTFLRSDKEKFNIFVYDQITSFGELISSKIIYHYLKDNGWDIKWLDARKLIKTDGNHGNADVDIEKTKKKITKAIDKSKNYVTQGFIGSNEKDVTTTLGFEGSDYSAALFAYVLKAESVTIWKDVPGILNADPRYFREYLRGGEVITFKRTEEKYKYLSLQAYGPLFLMKPLLLGRISYYDAGKMAYFGASVIHPKTIKPLQEKEIPLFVKSFLNPKEAGTEISNREDKIKYYKELETYPQYSKLPEIPYFMVKKENIGIVEIFKQDESTIDLAVLSGIFFIFNILDIKIALYQNTGYRIVVCFEKNEQFGELQSSIWRAGLEISHSFNEYKPVLITILNPNPVAVKTVNRHIHRKTVLMQQFTEDTYQMVVGYSDDMDYEEGSMVVL